MAGKNNNEDYEASLQERFDRWDNVYENGCRDPFWSDGTNLNLIRRHIIFYKSELEKSITDGKYPEICKRDVPPEMDASYIARQDEIRENARKTLSSFDENSDLKFIKRKIMSADDKFLEQIGAKAVAANEEGLKKAIDSDDLIAMRRYEHSDYYAEAFKECANKLRAYSMPENSQITLYDVQETEFNMNM